RSELLKSFGFFHLILSAPPMALMSFNLCPSSTVPTRARPVGAVIWYISMFGAIDTETRKAPGLASNSASAEAACRSNEHLCRETAHSLCGPHAFDITRDVMLRRSGVLELAM